MKPQALPLTEVSIVLPCLDEAETLRRCIDEIHEVLAAEGLAAEVIVADNGSTDDSPRIATEAGARLVPVPERGYGNALMGGMRAARGRYLIFLDADLSYPAAAIPHFVRELRGGAELVMGSRLRGSIEKGAMPPLHRYVGTPALTALARLFFGCEISDVNCGMRGLTREAFDRMELSSGGMEFATETIVKATRLGLRIAETPIDFARDQRGRPPHLQTFRDGWRHLRFMLMFSPTWLYLIPGLLFTLLGVAGLVAVVLRLSPYLGLSTGVLAQVTIALGVQILLLGVAAQGFVHLSRLNTSPTLMWLRGVLEMERGLLAGLTLMGGGAGILLYAFARIYAFMRQPDFDAEVIDLFATRLAVVGGTVVMVGVQLLFASFFLGLFRVAALRVPSMPPSAGSAADRGPWQ